MIKTILVPMGASQVSQNALNAAVSLANSLDARLRILYVEDLAKIREIVLRYKSVGAVSLDMPGAWIEEQGLREVREEIEKEKVEIRKIYDNLKSEIKGRHELVMREGLVTEVIAQEIRITDLVVMGKSLAPREECCEHIQPSLFHVLHTSNKPIITVCEAYENTGTTMVAYDGSRSANNSLKVLGDLSRYVNQAVAILVVRKTEEEAQPLLDEAARYFEPYGFAVEKIWKAGNATDMIVSIAAEKNASLIVMGGYGDNRIKELLIGSTAEKVLRTVKIPVLLSNG